MTSMPAAHFGLWDHGLLRSGYAADVIVFDYAGLDEVSTVGRPHRCARRRARARQRDAVVDGGDTPAPGPDGASCGG